MTDFFFLFDSGSSSLLAVLNCRDLSDCSEIAFERLDLVLLESAVLWALEFLDVRERILVEALLFEPIVDCLLESSSVAVLFPPEYLLLEQSSLYLEYLDLAVDLDCLLPSPEYAPEYPDLSDRLLLEPIVDCLLLEPSSPEYAPEYLDLSERLLLEPIVDCLLLEPSSSVFLEYLLDLAVDFDLAALD